jgi:hypothetical protein
MVPCILEAANDLADVLEEKASGVRVNNTLTSKIKILPAKDAANRR